MMPWVIAGVLYVLGGFGLYVVACDINGGPIQTKWKRAMYLVWPLVVVVQGFGDLVDAADGDRPNWLGG